MKKTLGILLAMVMAISVLSLPVMANPRTELGTELNPAVIVADFDFNKTTSYFWANYVGETGTFSYSGGGNGSTVIEESGNGILSVTGSLSMYLNHPVTNDKAWAGTAADYDVPGNNLRGEYITEFDIMLPALPSSNMNGFFTANSNSGEGTSNGMKFRLLSSGNINVEYGSGAQETVTKSTLKPGEWYTIKLVNDLESQTYDFYIDDVLLKSGVAYNNGRLAATVFNRPFMIDTTCSNGSVSTVCFDNLKIYKNIKGRISFGGDDFSGYTEDLVYSAETELREFAGLPLETRNGRQYGVTVNAAEGRAEFQAGSSLSLSTAATWNNPDITIEGTIPNQKKLSVEFDFTPTAESIGEFYRITESMNTHYGLILSANNGMISAKEALTGEVTPSSCYRSVELFPFEANETYRIKVFVDLDKKFTQIVSGHSDETLNGEYTRSGLADVYVNGILAGEELPLYYHCGNWAASMDITNLARPFGTTGGSTATYYIDNLAVYADERESILSTALNALSDKVSEKTFELPSTDAEGYAITWESDSEAIVIDGNTATVTNADTAFSVTLTATVADTENHHAVSGKKTVIVPPDYEVYVKFADADGIATSDLSVAKQLVNAQYRNNYSTDLCANLVAAVYDTANGNKLVACKVFDNAESGVTNPIGVMLEEGYEAKIFLFGGENNLAPVEFTQGFSF